MTAPANPRRSGKGHDAAISLQQDDDLQRWSIARSVLRSIESAPDNWSTRIGLYGKWGSGKTSVLNFIEEQARIRNESKPDGITWVVVRFSAWDAEGRDGVIQRFYQALLEQLEKVLGRASHSRIWGVESPGYWAMLPRLASQLHKLWTLLPGRWLAKAPRLPSKRASY